MSEKVKDVKDDIKNVQKDSPDLTKKAEDTIKEGTTKSTSTTSTTVPGGSKKFNKDQLATTVKTLQFAWFVGHLFTLIGVFFFTLSYLKIGKRFYKFWYNLAVIGVVSSFGIINYQIVKKQGFDVKELLKRTDFHYLALGIMFFILKPYIIFPILPFQIFSLFHVLSYAKAELLPVFGQDSETTAYKTIDNFVKNNNGKSIQVASLLEVYSLFFLGVRVLFFRKRSLTPFLVYLIFIKLRYETSGLIRNIFKRIELKIDDLINNLNNPKAKDIWIKVKDVLRKSGDFILVNDYTKEKST